jgi:hypothetical protein
MKTNKGKMVVYGLPLSDAAVASLQANGHLPDDREAESPTPSSGASKPSLQPLTPVAQQIWAALSGRPLNDRQIALLEIYARACAAGEPPISVQEAGRRLVQALDDLGPARAEGFVKGSLRSFGRRLRTLKRPPVRLGYDRNGDGVGDEVPLLALLEISTGPSGEVRHRLTDDGVAAVAAALALTSAGHAASGVQTGDAVLDDPDQVVSMGMTRLAAALLFRVQKGLGLSMDDTIKTLAAQAGAG